VRVVPAKVTWMTPPHVQLQVEPWVSAGIPPSRVFDAPGDHGAVTGTHGIGVKTPNAAAVAEATVGLVSVVHIPNGGMLTIGALSAMFAPGTPSIMTRETGRTLSVLGAIPKEHINMAPVATLGGIAPPISSIP
jgi:hypothetical protein